MLTPHFQKVMFGPDAVLVRSGNELDQVYFSDSGAIAFMLDMPDGQTVATKDGVIRRMIDKWLNAGVVEDGLLRRTTEGTPQGGVVSPCISNIFLHHVLDEWFETHAWPAQHR
jgi:hypothetical protein